MNIAIKKISKLMTERKISAAKLAIELEMNSTIFYDWKKGKANPSQKTLQKLSEYFQVPISYFYDESTDVNLQVKNTSAKLEYQILYEALSYDSQIITLGFMQGLLQKEGKEIDNILDISG